MNILIRIKQYRTAEIATLCMLSSYSVNAQGTAPSNDTVAPHVMMISGTLAPADARSIVREIDDPHSGARWLLMHDPSAAGGPGQLVLAATRQPAPNSTSTQHSKSADAIALPVVRSGDALVVEEHTSIADSRLEAVALGPAAIGGSLRVRLKVGGRIISAVCLGSGRASLNVPPEAQR